MANVSLQGAIEAISSERLTDRTSGLAAYSDIFSKERVLRDLHGQDQKWLAIFQAHFQCVMLEGDACLRKGTLAGATTASVNRLKTAAASLRWLLERSVKSFQRQTAKHIVNHIVDSLTRRKDLLTPIILDYLKALRILLSHRGHRNSVDANQWISIASLCFNIVHNRTSSANLPLLDVGGAGPSSEASGSGTRSNSRKGDESSSSPSKRILGLEDIEEMGCLEELMSSPVAPLNDHIDKIGLRLLAQYGLFLSSFPNESTAHLPALAGLNKLLREIEFNQSNAMRAFATRYWDALCVLWETKSKAVKEQLVVTFRILFPYLTPSDMAGVEQDDLIRLRSHFVYLQRRLDGDGENRFSLGPLQTQHLSMRLAPGAAMPYQSPAFAAGRTFAADSALSWATLELASDVTAALIRLHAVGVDGTRRVAENRSKEAGPSTATAAAAEHGEADDDDDAPVKAAGSRKRATASRARTASRALPRTTQSPRADTISPTKRLRVEEPTQPVDAVSGFIDGLAEAQGTTLAKARATRLWRLQMASFFIARHYTTTLKEEDRQRLATRIVDILGDGDPELQSWAFICLAALLSQPRDSLTSAISTIENVWTLCCRRIQVAAVSRSAALAADALLRSNLLDKLRYLPELRTLFADLDLAAPPFPFDSVCDFFSSALDLASTDVAMAKAPCHSQVTAWLAAVWSPAAGIERGFRTRGNIEEHDSHALVELLCRLCRLSVTAHQQPGGPTLLPGNAIVEQIAYEAETQDLRAFLLTATLSYERPQSSACELTRLPQDKSSRSESQQGQAAPALRTLQATEQRITSILKRAVEALTEQWRPPSSSDEGASLTESASVEQIRRTLDLITTTLLFQAHLSLAYAQGDEALTSSAHSLLRTVMASVSARDRWSVSSRSTLLAAIAPLLGGGMSGDSPLSQSSDVSTLLKALVRPGPCSGVRQVALAPAQGTAGNASGNDARARCDDAILTTIWKSASRDVQKAFLRLLRQCLHSLCDMPADEDGDDSVMQNRDDDDWGQVRQAKSEADEVMKPAKDYGTERFALTASIALCVDGLVSIEKITRKPDSQTKSNHLMDDVLLSGPLVALDRAARPVFAAFAQRRLDLDEEVATQVMERLGTDYLPDYEYKLDEDALSNVIDFCGASMDLWHPPEGAMDSADAEVFGRYFARALHKGKTMPWRAKIRAAAYLEELLKRNVESSEGWTDRGEADVLCSTALLLTIYGLMQEGDIRVRFAATTMIARLFDCVPVGAESELYDVKLTQVLTSDWTNFEGVLTRLLTLANVMIRSSPLRASALFNIMEPFVARLPRGQSQHQDLVHAKALFAAVSTDLGFSAPPDLFKVFAAQITFGLDSIDSDPTRLPWAVLGYSSSFHCLEHNFMAIGSMMAAIALDKPAVMPRFASLARSFGKTEKEGVAECLPVVAAIQLVIEVTLALDQPGQSGQLLEPGPILQELKQRITGGKATGGLATQKALEKTFANSLDRVVVETLSQFAESDCGLDSIFARMLKAVDGRTAKELAALAKGVEAADAPKHAHVPHRPVAPAFQVYQTVRIVTSTLDLKTEAALAYHVIHQMLSLIWKERLVNDQLRHLHALRLFVAMKSEAIGSNAVVLRALLHGCSILMGQPDLLQLASGIASWCFKRCVTFEKPLSHLSTILISMAEKADAYVTKHDARGEAMFDWLGSRILEPLLQSSVTSKHAFVAVCAYPRQLPDVLLDITANELPLHLEALTEVVVHQMKASANVHLLIRVREALASADVSQISGVFARTTIWHLFTRLRSNPSADEARVIADILFALKDKIQTPSAEQYQIENQTLGDANAELGPLVNMLAKSDKERPYEDIKIFIAFQLLRIQRGDDLALAETAFYRLRAIHTQDPDFHLRTAKWPDAMSDELALVRQYPTTPFASPQTSNLVNVAESKVDGSDYDVWIRFIATELCNRLSLIVSESFYAQIRDVVATYTPLAATLFAPLLHAYLFMFQEYGGDDSVDTSSFDHTMAFVEHLIKVLKNDKSDPQSWAAIINALLYLRTQKVAANVESEPTGTSDHWLPIDFLLLAKRSVDCQLYSTALLWCELQREHRPAAWAKAPDQAHLLYEVYSNIEDPDSFYGIQHKDLRASLLRRLHHEEEWRRAFELHAADYESSAVVDRTRQSQAGIGQALHQMGFDKLASSLGGAGSDVVNYDIAWRTEDWNLPAVEDPVSGSSANVFAALRALHQEQDATVVSRTISTALASEARALSGVGVEAVSQVRRVCRDLMSLGVAQQWSEDLAAAKGDLSAAFSQCSQWQLADQGLDFDDYERITTVRQSLLRSQRHRLQTNQIGDLLEPATEEAIKTESALLIRLCRAAREQDRQQAAMNAVTRAQKLCDDLRPSDRPAELTPEFASVLWTHGEQAIAIQALSETIESLPSPPTSRDDRLLKAKLLAELGHWRATARSQQPRAIDENLFRPAHTLVQEDETSAECAAVCYQYALFADDQYRALRHSAEVQQLETFVNDRREELRQNSLEMSRLTTKDFVYKQLHHHRVQAEKILRQDEALLAQHTSGKDYFLRQAFKMYAFAMKHSSNYDGSVVRLTSLWFENAHDDGFNEAIRESIIRVPSHKWLPLTHQLSSRLSKYSDRGSSGPPSPLRPFHRNVSSVMTAVCSHHPFHSLYAIYALRKADFDAAPTPPPPPPPTRGKGKGAAAAAQASSASTPTPTPSSLRAAAAHELWDRVKASSPHRARVAAFEEACDAYVEWAELDLKRQMPHIWQGNHMKPSPYSFRPSTPPNGKRVPGVTLKLKQLKDTNVPVATADLAVDSTGAYRDMVTIARYSDVFATAGGIHLPKIVDCIGSDGLRYKQLFKSDDDLRQDAVMQQVFRLLNDLLTRDRKASQRHLRIRTYVVLPLGPQCGLLEFVTNTCPIGESLVEAHEMHRKEHEWSPSESRAALAAVMGKTPSEKLEAYRSVCKNMPPAFRHYFMERIKTPPTWLAVRLNYTRSVATTSIIGHVLGLGDRHVSNILVDKVTGEVIHIDFGVAFEQGKLLPIPELVPFRLTRDIVDGMGLSGVEGVFRRCCEETLRVLRSNKDVIQTVLEVFKYDPLFAWTSNPVKILQAQRGGAGGEGGAVPSTAKSGGRNSTPGGTRSPASTTGDGGATTMTTDGGGGGAAGRDTASLSAERAIGTVVSKLSTSLSVQTTVTELIQSAMDEGNLSSIFHGWQAGL